MKIPWDDLRYIFGEIMYGGHIVDDWDRRMSQKYLLYFMRDELLDEIARIRRELDRVVVSRKDHRLVQAKCGLQRRPALEKLPAAAHTGDRLFG